MSYFKKVNIQDTLVTGRTAGVSPNRMLMGASTIRLVGAVFDGDTLDENFWTEATTNAGTVTVGGECELKTGTTANGTTKIKSAHRARFVVSDPSKFQSTCEWHSAGDTDNIRRIGMYDDDNGFFFQYDGTTFSIGSRTDNSGSPVDTLVASDSFNQEVWEPETDRVKVVIELTTKAVYFYGNGVLLHKLTLTHDNHPTKLTLPITMENNNDNGNTTNNEFHCIGMVINRIGNLHTNPVYKFIGTNTTTVCKRTAGILHVIVNTDNAGNVEVYDNTSAAGTQIASIDTAKALGTLTFNAPFSNGLTIVTSGGAQITVVYE